MVDSRTAALAARCEGDLDAALELAPDRVGCRGPSARTKRLIQINLFRQQVLQSTTCVTDEALRRRRDRHREEGMGGSIDFNLADFDTVALLTPVTRAAEEWVEGHLPRDVIRWGGGVAIEARNVAQVVQRICESGLRVETG